MKPGTSIPGELRAALLAYRRNQGRRVLAERAVPLPHGQIRDVLQLAAGGGEAGSHEAAVRDAACFFIRTVLLRPDADCYALLGVERNAHWATIKDHYRLLMRLLHPDFSASAPTAWPADAASRVNQAYELLSSPGHRREYDEKLGAATPPRNTTAPTRGVSTRPAALKPAVRQPRGRLKQLSLLFGVGGALAILVAVLATGPTESLVQRAKGTRPAPAVAQLPTIAAEPRSESDRLTAARAVKRDIVAVPPQASTESDVSRAAQPALLSAVVSPASVESARAPTRATPAAARPPEPTQLAPAAAVVADSPKAQPAPSAQPASTAQAGPGAGPTLGECHPVFSILLQQMESGWGDRVLGMLDRPARAAPSTQALLARYNAIVDERRPVKLSGIAFSSERKGGLLIMTGRVLIEPRDQRDDVSPRELALRAEFASRDGRVVLTRLAPASE